MIKNFVCRTNLDYTHFSFFFCLYLRIKQIIFSFNNNIHLCFLCLRPANTLIPSKLTIELHATEFDAIVAGEAIIAVKFLISDSNIGPSNAIAQLHTTYTAFKAIQMIEQAKTFDYHGGTTTWIEVKLALMRINYLKKTNCIEKNSWKLSFT